MCLFENVEKGEHSSSRLSPTPTNSLLPFSLSTCCFLSLELTMVFFLGSLLLVFHPVSILTSSFSVPAWNFFIWPLCWPPSCSRTTRKGALSGYPARLYHPPWEGKPPESQVGHTLQTVPFSEKQKDEKKQMYFLIHCVPSHRVLTSSLSDTHMHN